MREYRAEKQESISATNYGSLAAIVFINTAALKRGYYLSNFPVILQSQHYTFIICHCCYVVEHWNILYTCCRDGKMRNNETSRKTDKTRKCSKGSRKLPTYCLARMYVKVEEATGKVEVLYNSTHTNHCFGKEECKYLPLSKSVQTEMQQKFSMGITLERIMDGMFYHVPR